MGLKDKLNLSNKDNKTKQYKEEKPIISNIDSSKEVKKSSLGMILFALVIDFIVGTIVWTIFRFSIVLTDLIWGTAFNLANFYWLPLIICAIGGLCIGLFTKYYGNNLHTIEEIVEIVQTKGEFKYDKLSTAAIAFLLPIIFGGSIGPEAGLTGIIVDLCTRLNTALKKAGIRVVNLPEITVSAAVSSIFGTPIIGIFSGESGVFYRDKNDELYNEYNPKDYTFRREVKFILYTASALGSFGAFILLGSIFQGGMGLPRFTAITLQFSDIIWIIPCLIMGYIGGLLYGIALFSGADPMFCVSITTAATLASIQRRPLLVLALLFLCFPLSSVLWLGLACLIGAALPIPKKWLKE